MNYHINAEVQLNGEYISDCEIDLDSDDRKDIIDFVIGDCLVHSRYANMIQDDEDLADKLMNYCSVHFNEVIEWDENDRMGRNITDEMNKLADDQ